MEHSPTSMESWKWRRWDQFGLGEDFFDDDGLFINGRRRLAAAVVQRGGCGVRPRRVGFGADAAAHGSGGVVAENES